MIYNYCFHSDTVPNIEASIESLIHDVVLEDGSSFASIKISFEVKRNYDIEL